MHMADALISPAVGGAMWATGAATAAVAVHKLRDADFEEKRVPLMGVMGAFVFAAQMINFSIPGTGSSGHIGGGVLLAAVLGPYPAFLTIATVLFIQALFFADGGLLAFGCNLFNIGLIPCLIIYPLVFRPLVQKHFSKSRLMFASILSVVLSLQAGAFCVVLQTWLSGVSALPFNIFLLLMQPIHLAIGLIEGVVTGLVLWFLFEVRPDVMEIQSFRRSVPITKILLVFLVLTLVTGSLISLYASSDPDGLEWAIEKIIGDVELSSNAMIYERAADIQDHAAFMPDYDYRNTDQEMSINGTSVAGLVGSGIVFLFAVLLGWLIHLLRKRNRTASCE